MRFHDITEAPIKIYGLAYNGEGGNFDRLPREAAASVSEGVKGLGRRNTGGRVRFRTNSRNLNVKYTLKTLGNDIRISLCGSAGCDIYSGIGSDSRFIGFVQPNGFAESDKTNEVTLHLDGSLQQITIMLPRNELLASMTVGVDDDALLLEPIQYAIDNPVVFYGSSITEGGCCTRVGAAYTAIVSRLLDADHRNFGFSGAGRGEPAMAEYIAGLTMSAFVYDYDHNAPSAEHLSETHEPFFKIIRAAQPNLPIVIMSKPDFDWDREGNARRRDVIRATYDNAVAAGDRHVRFIDGETLYGDRDRDACTVDGCHPNDLGFYRMAMTLLPVLRDMLG